jgi:pimeloyl-ACP methyl ester carboxylesterase
LLAGCKSTGDSCCEPPKTTLNGLALTHSVDYHGNKIHYVTAGQGDHTLVFVHCWSGNLGFWDEQLPPLKDKAKLVLVDLPGHGKSDKPQTAYTMDYFAGAVLTVMRDAKVKKATLIGHSMGAPVICRVYKQAPDKVAALVSVDGIMRRPAMSPEMVQQITGPFHSPDYRRQATNFIGGMFPNPNTTALRDHVLSEMLQTPQYVMAGAMDGMFSTPTSRIGTRKEWTLPVSSSMPNPCGTMTTGISSTAFPAQTDYRLIEKASAIGSCSRTRPCSTRPSSSCCRNTI